MRDITSKAEPVSDRRMQATLDIIVNNTNDSQITDSKEDEFFGGIYVHPHWRQYRELINSAPPAFLYSLGAFITVVGFLGIIGNLTVIWIFLRSVDIFFSNYEWILYLNFYNFVNILLHFCPIFYTNRITSLRTVRIWFLSGVVLAGFGIHARTSTIRFVTNIWRHLRKNIVGLAAIRAAGCMIVPENIV